MRYEDLSVDFGNGLSMFPGRQGIEFRIVVAGGFSPRVTISGMGPQTIDEAEMMIDQLRAWQDLRRSEQL